MRELLSVPRAKGVLWNPAICGWDVTCAPLQAAPPAASIISAPNASNRVRSLSTSIAKALSFVINASLRGNGSSMPSMVSLILFISSLIFFKARPVQGEQSFS